MGQGLANFYIQLTGQLLTAMHKFVFQPPHPPISFLPSLQSKKLNATENVKKAIT